MPAAWNPSSPWAFPWLFLSPEVSQCTVFSANLCSLGLHCSSEGVEAHSVVLRLCSGSLAYYSLFIAFYLLIWYCAIRVKVLRVLFFHCGVEATSSEVVWSK